MSLASSWVRFLGCASPQKALSYANISKCSSVFSSSSFTVPGAVIKGFDLLGIDLVQDEWHGTSFITLCGATQFPSHTYWKGHLSDVCCWQLYEKPNACCRGCLSGVLCSIPLVYTMQHLSLWLCSIVGIVNDDAYNITLSSQLALVTKSLFYFYINFSVVFLVLLGGSWNFGKYCI